MAQKMPTTDEECRCYYLFCFPLDGEAKQAFTCDCDSGFLWGLGEVLTLLVMDYLNFFY